MPEHRSSLVIGQPARLGGITADEQSPLHEAERQAIGGLDQNGGGPGVGRNSHHGGRMAGSGQAHFEFITGCGGRPRQRKDQELRLKKIAEDIGGGSVVGAPGRAVDAGQKGIPREQATTKESEVHGTVELVGSTASGRAGGVSE